MLRRFAVETGKALRETGQALERTGMRVAGDESFVDSWSRHRPLMGVHNWMTHVAPEVAGTAWVAPSASVIGDVSLGAGASVFYGAIVRGDRAAVTIGKGTNVQDQAILTTGTSLGTPKRDATTPLTIGENVTIGHGASIQSCTIGDESLVGMGAVLMEGCVVESNALVAAGTVVAPGQVVASGQLWAGKPAAYVRDLTEAQIEGLKRQATAYTDLAERHDAAHDGVKRA